MFFSIIIFLNSCYAIEDVNNLDVCILGLYPVQGQSRTAWNNQTLLIPPMFNVDYKKVVDDFNSGIDLSGVSFSNIESDNILLGINSSDTLLELPDIELEEVTIELPISIEIIDRENEIFKLTIGGTVKNSISFIAKDYGLYDLEGGFKSDFIEFRWAHERFKVTVDNIEDSLSILIRPFDSELYPKVCYKSNFNLIGFDGEYSLGFINYKPYLNIVLKDSEESVLTVDIDQNKLSLKLNMDISLTSRDSISLETESFRIEEGDVDGNIEIRFDEEEQTVVLRIGEGSYFEITQNSSMRETIDKFYTEIAIDLNRLLPELAEDDDSFDIDMTVDDIKNILWEATGDDLEVMFDIIQDANEQRRGLVVPSELHLFLDLSKFNSQKNAELTFPLIEDSLALKMGLESDAIQINCFADISSISTASTAEVGYNSDGFFIFKVADLSVMSLVKLGVSLDGDIESIAFRVKNIEGDIDSLGFEVRSVEDSLLGLSALDMLLRGLEVQDDCLSWCFGYNIGREFYLRLSVPLNEMVKIRGSIDNRGLEFDTRIDFLGGVLTIDSRGNFECRIDRDNIDFRFIIEDE